jgi:hypothetical protein
MAERFNTGNLRGLLGARLVLGGAMVLSAAVVLWLGRDTSFSEDDLFYYSRVVNRGIGVMQYHQLSLEYLLAPHNNHLQLVGKLIYEGLFATAGTNYFWFRLVEAVGVLLCVGLFFELARVRIGHWAALAPSILLLFYGYAWEALLWPFDLHTLYALAAGLGALLCLERRGRLAEPAACALLILSVSTIELGLAFVGAVVVLLLAARRPSRLWIPAIPAVLYVAWYVWARQFHQPAYRVSDPLDLLHTIGEAAGAVIGALLALNPVDSNGSVSTVGTTAWPLLAGLLAAAIAIRLWRGRNTPFLWAMITLAGLYWLFLGLADRAPDASRYIFAGSIALLLLATEALRGRRFPGLVIAALFLVVAVTMPRNIELLSKGRDLKLSETRSNRIDAGAEQLAGAAVDPSFTPSQDPLVVARGGSGPVTITAGQYLSGAARIGPFGYSASQIAGQPAPLRDLADAVLSGAGGLRSSAASPPASGRDCNRVGPRSPGRWVAFTIPSGGAVLGAFAATPPPFRARRFGPSGVPLDVPDAGRWIRVTTPSSGRAGRWQGLTNRPALACRLPGHPSSPQPGPQ